MDSLILQAAIGLVFIFATGAALVSVITESMTRYVGLRSEYLLRGLRTLLDGNGNFQLPLIEAVTGRVSKRRAREAAAPVAKASATAAVTAAEDAAAAAQAAADAADAAAAQPRADADMKDAARVAHDFAAHAESALDNLKHAQGLTDGPREALVARVMAHPLIGATSKGGEQPRNAGDAPLANKQRRQLPSYVSGRTFARALLDVIVPDASGKTTLSEISTKIANIPSGDLPPHLRSALLSLAKDANDDVAAFRTNIEHWYDDQMDRVSGWYKRHIRWISLGISLAIVLLLNLNVLTIAHSLYTDEAVRGSVVTQATQASNCANKTPAQCLQDLRATMDTVRGTGLPIGWATVQSCTIKGSGCNWLEDRGLWSHEGTGGASQLSHLGLILLGWGIMAIALLPGANFWFDILGRLGTLRTSGPKPKTT